MLPYAQGTLTEIAAKKHQHCEDGHSLKNSKYIPRVNNPYGRQSQKSHLDTLRQPSENNFI